MGGYAWGRSTRDWKNPSAYKFDSARAPYLDALAADASAKGPRIYVTRKEPDMALVNPKGKIISTDSKNPIVIGVDVTGSMSSWPAEIFDRLPLLYQTLSQYRDDVEICFAAIGDATIDSYPLQVNDFGKGVALEEKIKALGAEGGGGGHITESYELFGYFMLEHCKVPNATSPFLLIYGDETFYDKVDPRQVKRYIGAELQTQLESTAVWNSLLQKFNVFYLQKPYGDGDSPGRTSEIREYWDKELGSQRVVSLPSCDRAVDIGLGLIAKYWGEYDDFTKSLTARHPDAKTKSAVDSSLRLLPKAMTTASVMSDKPTGRMTKSLID